MTDIKFSDISGGSSFAPPVLPDERPSPFMYMEGMEVEIVQNRRPATKGAIDRRVASGVISERAIVIMEVIYELGAIPHNLIAAAMELPDFFSYAKTSSHDTRHSLYKKELHLLISLGILFRVQIVLNGRPRLQLYALTKPAADWLSSRSKPVSRVFDSVGTAYGGVSKNACHALSRVSAAAFHISYVRCHHGAPIEYETRDVTGRQLFDLRYTVRDGCRIYVYSVRSIDDDLPRVEYALRQQMSSRDTLFIFILDSLDSLKKLHSALGERFAAAGLDDRSDWISDLMVRNCDGNYRYYAYGARGMEIRVEL